MGQIFKNQIGVDIIVSTCINLTGLASACIVAVKPSGSSVSWTATVSGSASQGMIHYETAASSDLDEAGHWYGYAQVWFSNTEHHPGERFDFDVLNVGEK